MAHVQVKIAIVVEVQKRCTGPPSRIVRPAFRGHCLECPVSKIAVELSRANTRDIQIRKPVTVEICRRQASAVTGSPETAHGSDIRERPVLEIAPETISL